MAFSEVVCRHYHEQCDGKDIAANKSRPFAAMTRLRDPAIVSESAALSVRSFTSKKAGTVRLAVHHPMLGHGFGKS
jgi:hypothetical protein